MATVTNHYDLIVLGADLAGLVAAALVARRGKRVLVVPHGPIDGTYRLGSGTLPLTTAPVIHMHTAPVRRTFQELGLWQQVRREPGRLEDLIHVVLDGARLDLEPGLLNTGTEVEREWPDDEVAEAMDTRHQWAAQTDEILDEILGEEGALSADSFWNRRFLVRVAQRLPRPDLDELGALAPGHPLRVAAQLAEPWLTDLTPNQLGKAASLRLAAVWGRGPEDLPRGEARMREILMQRIELHSGEIKTEVRVGDLVFRRGKLTGITLLGKEERYGAGHLIVAGDPRRFLHEGPFVPDQLPRAAHGTLAALADVAQRYVLHLEVDPLGLSPALGGMALCAPIGVDGANLRTNHGIGTTTLRIGPGSHEGLRRVSVTRVVAPDESLHDLRERIVDDLDTRGVLPFMRKHVDLIHSPHDGRPATDGSGDPVPGLSSTIEDRLPMHPLVGVATPPVLGVGILPQATGLKNLFFATRLGLPGLGLEGQFATGAMAAGLVVPRGRTRLSRSSFLKRA